MSLTQKEKAILGTIIMTTQTIATMQNVNDQLLFTTSVILTMQKDDESSQEPSVFQDQNRLDFGLKYSLT